MTVAARAIAEKRVSGQAASGDPEQPDGDEHLHPVFQPEMPDDVPQERLGLLPCHRAQVLGPRVRLLLLPRHAPHERREGIGQVGIDKTPVVEDAPVGGEARLVCGQRALREGLAGALRGCRAEVVHVGEGHAAGDLRDLGIAGECLEALEDTSIALLGRRLDAVTLGQPAVGGCSNGGVLRCLRCADRLGAVVFREERALISSRVSLRRLRASPRSEEPRDRMISRLPTAGLNSTGTVNRKA